MFISPATAHAFFKKLKALPNPNIVKKIGDHLAVGTLQPTFGRTSKPRRDGHFDLFEYSGSNITGAFRLIGPLK